MPLIRHGRGCHGEGHQVIVGLLNVQSAFSGVQLSDGRVSGSYHDSTNDAQGIVDFYADVTSIAVDDHLGQGVELLKAQIGERQPSSREHSSGAAASLFSVIARVALSSRVGTEDSQSFKPCSVP